LTMRRNVGLPLWQIPGAMIVALGYTASLLAGQLWSVMSRLHQGPADLSAPLDEPSTTA
jgi:hypothetical protein